MSLVLSEVSSSTLLKLQTALSSAKPPASPLTSDALRRLGIRAQQDAIVASLASLDVAACIVLIDAVLAERKFQERPPPELVWTGPEGVQATARDTAIVLSQLFESARERVVLAGYSFKNAETVLKPLHKAMQQYEVEVVMLVDIPQPKGGQFCGDDRGQTELKAFLDNNWPFGEPYPQLHCDRRALVPAPPWCSLHAKCVSVDGRQAFLSSANFTDRGQNRNLEAGVLIHDAAFAQQLEKQWMSLISGRLTYQYRPDTAPIVDHSSSSFATDEDSRDASLADSAEYLSMYPYTQEAQALRWIAKQGVLAPDEVNVDVLVDDEIVACLEWRWSEEKVALLVQSSTQENEQNLLNAGWRAINTTEQQDLEKLVSWLRET